MCQQDATDEDQTHVSLYNIVLGECCFGLEDAMEHIVYPMQRSHVQVDAHTLSVAQISMVSPPSFPFDRCLGDRSEKTLQRGGESEQDQARNRRRASV
jgi:hypothetical protein